MGIVAMTITNHVTHVDKDVLEFLQVKSLQIEHYLNNRPVLRCRLRVKEGEPWRPKVRDEVVVMDNNGSGDVRIFGGIVFSVTETDVVNYKHCDLDLDCTGYEVFADNVLINGIVPAGTLRSQLEAIVNNMGGTPPTGHGLSVDGSMPSGPAMPAQAFPWLTCRQAMDQLATAASDVNGSWNWKFDFDKHVKMEQSAPGGAPFALDDQNSTITSLQHTQSLANYVNELFLQFGQAGQKQVTDEWRGDGVNKSFVLNHPPAGPPPTVEEDGVLHAVAPTTGGSSRWSYDAPNRRLVVHASETAPGLDKVIKAVHTGQYPQPIFVRDQAQFDDFGPWTIFLEYPDVDQYDRAYALANGELLRRVGVVRRLTASTYNPGLEPGMIVDVTATKRGLVGADFLIERVSISHETALRNGSHLFRYEIEALEGNQYQTNWIDYFRGLQGKSSSARSGGSLSGGGGGPSGSVTIVSHAFWGGSRQFGLLLSNAWADVIDSVPIRLEGTSGGSPVTVRVLRRAAGGGVQVRARIVRTDTGVEVKAGAVTGTTTWNEEFITFTPDSGVHDYHLQVWGSSNAAQVFAIGVSV